jgi:hypothetical protein
LTVVVLGLAPGHDEALYLTAVDLGLFMSAIHLFIMVFERRRPTATD